MVESLSTEEREALAAELALGVLEGEERARALRLQLADPAFAAEVAAWAQRLCELHDGFDEAPPPQLWAAITQRLDPPSAVVTRLQTRVRRWRWGTVGAGLVAASFAVALALRPTPTPLALPPGQVVVAQLGDSANSAMLAANYNPATGALRIRAATLPSSKLSPELWVIPADGVPRSLGLVGGHGVTDLTVAAGHRALLQEGATLAITFEPPQGAPHLKPSSKPVAAGKISTI